MHTEGTTMPKTFVQLADEEMSKARSVSASAALIEMQENPEILLVDVRDEADVQVTGIGPQAINAPGRSIAWMRAPSQTTRGAILSCRTGTGRFLQLAVCPHVITEQRLQIC